MISVAAGSLLFFCELTFCSCAESSCISSIFLEACRFLEFSCISAEGTFAYCVNEIRLCQKVVKRQPYPLLRKRCDSIAGKAMTISFRSQNLECYEQIILLYSIEILVNWAMKGCFIYCDLRKFDTRQRNAIVCTLAGAQTKQRRPPKWDAQRLADLCSKGSNYHDAFKQANALLAFRFL